MRQIARKKCIWEGHPRRSYYFYKLKRESEVTIAQYNLTYNLTYLQDFVIDLAHRRVTVAQW